MGVRRRPRARCGSSAAMRASVNASPTAASQTTPTRCPRRDCSTLRSHTWRKRPPTGARRQCRMRCGPAVRACATSRSEPALVDVDRVARLDHVVRWYIHLLYDAVGVAAGDAHAALVGAVAIASGNGHGRLHGDAADERVLPGVAHLAQDEE